MVGDLHRASGRGVVADAPALSPAAGKREGPLGWRLGENQRNSRSGPCVPIILLSRASHQAPLPYRYAYVTVKGLRAPLALHQLHDLPYRWRVERAARTAEGKAVGAVLVHTPDDHLGENLDAVRAPELPRGQMLARDDGLVRAHENSPSMRSHVPTPCPTQTPMPATCRARPFGPRLA